MVCSLPAAGQNKDSVINKLTGYIQEIHTFSQYIPQEKVYLHFDNTSYYQGDNIWFKCYIVTATLHQAIALSKTLYVELLNPGGEIIDKRILKIENGQCHGDFTLNKLPFYSGFYEIRAYTKYMLNFGEEVVFSRLLPVFDKPKEEGHFEEKNMLKYGYGNYPMKRKKPLKEKKVTLKFFPEGGNLVQGIASQVAFEATDAYGNPLAITGTLVDNAKEEIGRFSVIHDGRGVFTYTPGEGKQKAIVDYNGKKYQFDMPTALSQGFTLQVDNVSDTDSIEVILRKNKNTSPQTLGVALISEGQPQCYSLFNIKSDKAIRLKFDKTKLPSGVSRIVLFNSQGEILCDRLLFTNKTELLDMRVKKEKEDYKPYELVNMEFTLSDKDKKPLPVPVPFSLSVKDGTNEVQSDQNILTDILLMSEIKGYIHRPSYYFESDDLAHRTALDLLMMVQGWRRYSWNQMAGIEPFKLRYKPEQDIETEGQVVSFVKKVPKPNVHVSSFLLKKEENEEAASFATLFVTDSVGRFSFTSDIYGKYNMILSVSVKGKSKDYRIILDRLFTPVPKRYQYAELQVTIAETEGKKPLSEEVPHFVDEHQ